mgnify:CR=1 FL=1|tara:strand:- start:821 stop:997 length:177 start_codon:yes stop_codon:yes gene_type:complete
MEYKTIKKVGTLKTEISKLGYYFYITMFDNDKIISQIPIDKKVIEIMIDFINNNIRNK